MFNVGGGEFLVILLIGLIVLGPQKLPEAARQVANIARELRRISSGFQDELRAAMDEPVEAAARDRGTRVVSSEEEPGPTFDSKDASGSTAPGTASGTPAQSPAAAAGMYEASERAARQAADASEVQSATPVASPTNDEPTNDEPTNDEPTNDEPTDDEPSAAEEPPDGTADAP